MFDEGAKTGSVEIDPSGVICRGTGSKTSLGGSVRVNQAMEMSGRSELTFKIEEMGQYGLAFGLAPKCH